MLEQGSMVFVGSDVLEIMSIAMYAEPLVIYRELIQNSADGIERATRSGLLASNQGAVSVTFDPLSRTVTVLDNGYGLPDDEFDHQMLALGASSKRTESYRGFRGIGRLAGLGHCRKLVFRSRAKADRYVSEASWDGLKVRDAMLRPGIVALDHVMKEAVSIARVPASDEPEHFFEVRLEGVRRLPDDRLFDSHKVANYLSQVAPVAFSRSFSLADRIKSELLRRTPLLEVRLTVGGRDVFKPYEDAIEVRKGRFSSIRDVQFVEVPSTDDQVAAFGWIAHTDYLGALRHNYPGRGLRVRSGNLQVGEDDLLARAFPEERFNAWSIGEFHVFDARLRPNARRDAFEPSVAVDDLFNQLAPYGNAIAKRCRLESKKRQVAKRLESVNSSLDDLEKHLRRNRSTLANAVRQYIYEQLASQLGELQSLSRALLDDAAAEVVLKTEHRMKQLLRRKSKESRRPSQRDLGQLDAVRWLYSSGQEALIGRIVADLTRFGANRKLIKDS